MRYKFGNCRFWHNMLYSWPNSPESPALTSLVWLTFGEFRNGLEFFTVFYFNSQISIKKSRSCDDRKSKAYDGFFLGPAESTYREFCAVWLHMQEAQNSLLCLRQKLILTLKKMTGLMKLQALSLWVCEPARKTVQHTWFNPQDKCWRLLFNRYHHKHNDITALAYITGFLKQGETWIWWRAPERQPHIFCEWFWIWQEAQALAALQVTAEPGAAWPFPVTHSGKERKRKGAGSGRTEEKKTSRTGDSLSGALRDESLIGHRSISRSSGSCTHLMIGHDVSLNAHANEWLST